MHLENLTDTLMNVKKNEELHHKKQLAVNKNKLINRDAKAGIEEVILIFFFFFAIFDNAVLFQMKYINYKR